VLEGAKPAHDLFDFSVWGSAFGLVHLDGALRHWPGKPPDATALAKAHVEFAWRKQKPCGGWSYRATDKDGSQTILCAAHVEGLLLWKARGVEVDEARLARAIGDLKGNRDRKGSFGYYHEGKYESTKGTGWTTPESIGRSVQGQLALVLAGEEPKESLVPHLRRFRDDYRHLLAQRGVYAHSPPYMIAGYYYHFGVLFAARALRLAPLPEDEGKEIRRLLLHEILREQAEDGSWVDSPAGGEPYATAMALLTLVELSR
ncbi:MAG TPA: prenyltransferase/squalene oxidase repeat-containing protein, partial [Planctomycetota bacterium]|nr:prenyltransferase/squalene oxidase repeat-containing protein [Planctomycetota bacterium]